MELQRILAFGDELNKIAEKQITLNVPTTKEDASKLYKKYRDPAASMLVGGGGGTLLSRAFGGGTAEGSKGKWLIWRLPAALGAAAGLGDYYAMRPARRAGSPRMAGAKRTKSDKTAMVGSSTFTPARSLQQSSNVSNFHDNMIHKGDRLRPPTMGNKFKVPEPPSAA